jgi:DNA polymerase V
VLSNNDGCIIARSNEAKALGLKMGTPLFKAEELIEEHKVSVYSSNYALYGDMSHRVMEALQEFTPEVEVYSIDEAFMTLNEEADKTFHARGTSIREKVLKWTGIPVSVGIAQTKTLAKIANLRAMKDTGLQGVLDLMPVDVQTEALEQTPVGEVWGVGPAYSKLLRAANITTARKLRDADRRWIRQRMTIVGARIVEELRGISCLPFEQCPSKKEVCHLLALLWRACGIARGVARGHHHLHEPRGREAQALPARRWRRNGLHQHQPLQQRAAVRQFNNL